MVLSTDSISEQIHQILRDRILNGTYHSGQRLLESTLADEFVVSRTPIREAVLRLQGEGLLTMNPRRGISVSMISEEQVLEIYQIYMALGPLAVQLACTKRTPAELERLERALSTMEETPRNSNQTELEEQHAYFHQTLFEAAKSPKLLDILSGLLGDIRRFARESYAAFGRDEETLREHRDLLNAVRKGDSVRAQQLSKAHILQSRKAYMKVHKEKVLIK